MNKTAVSKAAEHALYSLSANTAATIAAELAPGRVNKVLLARSHCLFPFRVTAEASLERKIVKPLASAGGGLGSRASRKCRIPVPRQRVVRELCPL